MEDITTVKELRNAIAKEHDGQTHEYLYANDILEDNGTVYVSDSGYRLKVTTEDGKTSIIYNIVGLY